MANQLKEKQKKLKKLRTRNIILNLVCICLAGSGLWWTATYFWRYVNYEVTNDAFVDQYVAPLNVRASGYIKEVCFKEHQYVRQGDTLLVLDNREYQIKVKEAEAALLDAHGSQEVLHSGIETAHTNIAVQDANIAEAKTKLWQLEQDYHRFERLKNPSRSNSLSKLKLPMKRQRRVIRHWLLRNSRYSHNIRKQVRKQRVRKPPFCVRKQTSIWLN